MTLAVEQAKAAKELDYLLEIEVGHRIDTDTWAQEGAPNTAVFSIAHPDGTPSKVKACVRFTHVITEHTEVGSIVACQAAASSWFYDDDTGTLYVHMSAGNSPSTAGVYYLSSYFLECLCSGQREGSQALYFNGVWYLPYLNESSIPNVSLEVSMFSEGGVKQSFGTISLLNADGYFDERISDFIYSGKAAVLKVGAPGDAYGDFVTIWRGWTGGIRWTDEYLEIETEDERKIAE